MTDPLDSFLSGIGSSLTRACIGVGAIYSGELLHFACRPEGFQLLDLFFMVVNPVVMPIMWLGQGTWGMLGLLSLIGMLSGLWLFMKDHSPKVWLFTVFTLSVVFFGPIGSDRLKVAIAYFGIATVYWVGPWSWTKLMGRRRG